MPPILPPARTFAPALACALLAAACGAPEKQPDVASPDTIACVLDGQRLVIRFLPDRTIEVSADEASGLIRNGKLVGTPR